MFLFSVGMTGGGDGLAPPAPAHRFSCKLHTLLFSSYNEVTLLILLDGTFTVHPTT